jgi:hypothetical protein
MLKLVSWDLKDDHGYHAEILTGPKATFEKQAAAFEGEYSTDILDAIDKLEKKAGYTYLLINAMGAGEFYGSNKNNDYFPEKVLKEYHKTFEALAHVYKHHVNKDPRRSYGKVTYSFYNEKMHRVELIVEVNNSKAHDILDRIARGNNIAVSMGCRVPWDECSECGNRAKTRREYCVHLRRGSAGRLRPDGRKPYAVNLQPKFFDISFVTIPADPTASVLSKVASHVEDVVEGVTSGYDMDDLLKVSGLKKADIIKRIEGKVESAASDPKNLIPFIQKDAPKEEIKNLTDNHELSKILSTLLSMQIMPKKRDFQRMVLYSAGKHNLADQLDRRGCEFPIDRDATPIMPADVSPDFMSSEIAEQIPHWIPERSLTKPLVIIRVMNKMAELSTPIEIVEEAPIKKANHIREGILNHLQLTKKASVSTPRVLTLGGGFTKIAASPVASDYKGQKGDAIATDLDTNYSYDKTQIQPWMVKNDLWDTYAEGYYGTKGWQMPWSDYSDYANNLGDDYATAKHVATKGYTDAGSWDTFSDQYGYGPLTEGASKNLAHISNPPAQNALTTHGLKGYQALKQTATAKPASKFRDQQQAQEKNRKGLPTRFEEEGKILPANMRESSLNKISSHISKKAAFEYMDPDMSTPAEEAGKTPKRVDMNMRAPEKNPFFAVTGLGALYLGYQRLFNLGASKNLPKLERTIIKNPWMLPLLAGVVGAGTTAGQRLLNKNASLIEPIRKFEPGGIKSIIAAAVPSYFYSGSQEAKVRRGEQIDNFQNFARKHPLLTTLGSLVAVRGGVKAINKYATAEDIVGQMDQPTIDKLFKEIIS